MPYGASARATGVWSDHLPEVTNQNGVVAVMIQASVKVWLVFRVSFRSSVNSAGQLAYPSMIMLIEISADHRQAFLCVLTDCQNVALCSLSEASFASSMAPCPSVDST